MDCMPSGPVSAAFDKILVIIGTGQAGLQLPELALGVPALDVFRKIRIHVQRGADPLPFSADLDLGADAPGVFSAFFHCAQKAAPPFHVRDVKKSVAGYTLNLCVNV